jgi:putative endonuclease
MKHIRRASGMQYYLYILTTAKNTALYTDITNNLIRRVYEHKNDLFEGFAKGYQAHKLVYYDSVEDILTAIACEKQIKSWLRKKKIELINTFNPDWRGLYDELTG